jgi:hypothetical protein
VCPGKTTVGNEPPKAECQTTASDPHKVSLAVCTATTYYYYHNILSIKHWSGTSVMKKQEILKTSLSLQTRGNVICLFSSCAFFQS